MQISWTTVVVHSRDNLETGMAHEVKSLENQPQFSQTAMWQNWFGSFQTNPKYFQKVATELKKNYLEFSTDWLTN